MFSKFFQDQQVSVNITANKWVVGIIVGFVEICAKVTILPREVVRFG
jgi:hypothetical protein